VGGGISVALHFVCQCVAFFSLAFETDSTSQALCCCRVWQLSSLPFLAWSTPWGFADKERTGETGKGPPHGQKNASRGPVCQTVGASVVGPAVVWEGGGFLVAKKHFLLVCIASPLGQKGLSAGDWSSDLKVRLTLESLATRVQAKVGMLLLLACPFYREVLSGFHHLLWCELLCTAGIHPKLKVINTFWPQQHTHSR